LREIGSPFAHKDQKDGANSVGLNSQPLRLANGYRHRVFLLLALVFLGCVAAISSPAFKNNPFASLAADQVLDLDLLTVGEVAKIKLRHVVEHASYPVMLFGNSRPMPVGAADLGLEERDFFNMTLSGQSFRGSVTLLEALDKAGRAPKLALVHFDHVELQLYNAPDFPSLPHRILALVNDLAAGWRRQDISSADSMRQIWRFFLSERDRLSTVFNWTRFALGTKIFVAQALGRPGTDYISKPRGASGYRSDGSRFGIIGDPEPIPKTLANFNRNILPGYLVYDMERLAAIAARGTKVIMFETFVHPALNARLTSQPSPFGAEARATWLAACARAGLACHPAPIEVTDNSHEPWADASHPPVAILAPYIRRLMAREATERQ
jgi:hypothetical protein